MRQNVRSTIRPHIETQRAYPRRDRYSLHSINASMTPGAVSRSLSRDHRRPTTKTFSASFRNQLLLAFVPGPHILKSLFIGWMSTFFIEPQPYISHRSDPYTAAKKTNEQFIASVDANDKDLRTCLQQRQSFVSDQVQGCGLKSCYSYVVGSSSKHTCTAAMQSLGFNNRGFDSRLSIQPATTNFSLVPALRIS